MQNANHPTVEKLKTWRLIVESDANFGHATRAKERRDLEAAIEREFRDPSNRNSSRNQIAERLRGRTEYRPSDLSVGAFTHRQQRAREVREMVSAARAEAAGLRRVPVPTVELDSREAMCDFGQQSIILCLKRMDQRAQRAEARADLQMLTPDALLAAAAGDVAAIEAIDKELDLPFSVPPSAMAPEPERKAWEAAAARRRDLRQQREMLQLRLVAAQEVADRQTPDPMAALTGETSLSHKLRDVVAPVVAERVQAAEAIETAAAELDTAWNGGPDSLGIGAILATIEHTGEPMAPAEPVTKPERTVDLATKAIDGIENPEPAPAA